MLPYFDFTLYFTSYFWVLMSYKAHRILALYAIRKDIIMSFADVLNCANQISKQRVGLRADNDVTTSSPQKSVEQEDAVWIL